jgi:hypothetical protein
LKLSSENIKLHCFPANQSLGKGAKFHIRAGSFAIMTKQYFESPTLGINVSVAEK